MLIGILLFWIIVFAALAVRAESRGPRFMAWIFRLLAISLCISLVVEAGRGGWGVYRVAILAGLALSLGGDIFMMLRRKRFLEGLALFLAAQVCYTIAFVSGVRFRVPPVSLSLIAAVAAVLAAILLPRLGRLKIPVFLYMGVLLAMAASAAVRFDAVRTPAALAAAAGAALFVISDAVLAANRFVKPFRAAQTLILIPYFAAQGLIALSACL